MSVPPLGAADDLPPIPATPKKPVTDDYGGVKVTDDYRWLESGANPEVKQWSNEQNSRARAYLDHLANRTAIVDSLNRLYTSNSIRFSSLIFRGGGLFAIQSQPPKLQPFLVMLRSVDDPNSARAIVDPNVIDPSGSTTIDFYVPSLDGKLVAVSLSKGGMEDGTVSVFDVATGEQLSDSVPRVNGATAGGSLAWNADSTGFWYTRYPHAGERHDADLNFYQQIYLHRLGAPPAKDEYVLGKEFPRIAEIALDSSDDGKYLLVRVANGDGGEFLHYILGPEGKWHQIARLSDEIPKAAFGPGDSLYMLSRKDAPMGKLLEAAPPAFTLSTAKTVVTPGRSSLDGFLAAGPHLYLRYMAGGPSKLVMKDTGLPERPIEIPAVSSVGELVRGTGGQLLFENQSYTEPSAWYHYDPATGQINKTALFQTSPAGFSDVEVIRQFAVSKDGTHVPMSILRRKGTKLDGNNPLLLYGYGPVPASRNHRISRFAGAGGWITEASGWSPICGAGPKMARHGTSRAASPTSRTFSTISSPVRSTSSRPITRVLRSWRSRAAATAAC